MLVRNCHHHHFVRPVVRGERLDLRPHVCGEPTIARRRSRPCRPGPRWCRGTRVDVHGRHPDQVAGQEMRECHPRARARRSASSSVSGRAPRSPNDLWRSAGSTRQTLCVSARDRGAARRDEICKRIGEPSSAAQTPLWGRRSEQPGLWPLGRFGQIRDTREPVVCGKPVAHIGEQLVKLFGKSSGADCRLSRCRAHAVNGSLPGALPTPRSTGSDRAPPACGTFPRPSMRL